MFKSTFGVIRKEFLCFLEFLSENCKISCSFLTYNLFTASESCCGIVIENGIVEYGRGVVRLFGGNLLTLGRGLLISQQFVLPVRRIERFAVVCTFTRLVPASEAE